MEEKLWHLKDKLTDLIFLGMTLVIPLILLIFVLFPVFKVALASFMEGDQLSLVFYRELFLTGKVKLLGNTLLVNGLSTLFASALGLALALVVARSSWPGKNLLNFAAILHIISPPFVSAIVFIMLFGRRGFITSTLLGLDVNLIGWGAIVFLQTLGNASIAYLIMVNVLKRIDKNLERSALDLGASRLRVFFTVTLPLMLPGITAAALLVFTNILADFGTPILVGGGFRVLASEAYIQVIARHNMGFAAALCMVLLVPCLSIVLLEKLVLGNRLYLSSSLSQEGRDGEKEQILSKPVLVALSFICFVFAFLTFAEVATLVIGAFTNIWGYDYTLSLRHLTAVWEQGFRSIKNSLLFATYVAIFGPLLGICTAYFFQKSKNFSRRFFEFLAILPYAVPGPVMGISYILAFNSYPLLLTGTFFIVVFVSIVRELPISFNAGKAVLHQVAGSLEQASTDLGSNRWQTLTRVVLPLMAPAYRVGVVHAFIHAMITIGAIIFLITPRNKVITFEIFTAVNSGRLGEGAAFALFLIIMTLAGLGGFHLVSKMPAIWKIIKERLTADGIRAKKYN